MEGRQGNKQTPRCLSAQCIVDVVMWMAIGLPVLFLFLRGIPFDSGFFCDDHSLMYPYKKEVISNSLLMVAGFGLSFFVPILVELLNRLERRGKPCCLRTRDVPDWLKGYAVFLLGFVFDQLYTETIKSQVGRLRPNFFSVCKPVFDTTNCTTRYTTDYRCSTEEHDAREIRSSRQAFPSGHAALSMYIAVYFSMYIQQRLEVSYSKTLKFVLQSSLVLLSLVCGITRLQDNMHHASDVIAGFLLGSGIAYVVYQSVAKKVLTKRGQLRLNIEQGTCQADLYSRHGVSPRSATTLLLFQNDMSNGVSTPIFHQDDKETSQSGGVTNSTTSLSVT